FPAGGSSDPGDGPRDCPAGAGAWAGAGLRPDGPAQALEFLSVALDYLAHADAGQWAAGSQADCLRAFAVAEARQAAAHARVLAAFSVPGGGLAGDGHRSPRVWLTWQTHATRRGADAPGTRIPRRRALQAPPPVAAALAAGQVSLSWARQITDWSDRLPDDHRAGADAELLAAAGAGADLADLAGIAEELH